MSLVSVIVPTYKRPDLLKDCFDSVVRQQHRPLQVVVADDASGDHTPSVVSAFPRVDGISVCFIQQAVNRGVSAARNAAVQTSSGDILAFLDSDDVWFDDHLASLLPLIDSITTDVAYARGDIRAGLQYPSIGKDYGPSPLEEAEISRTLYLTNPILPSVTVMRRSTFDSIGWFDEEPDIQHAEDWDFYLRAALRGMRFGHVRRCTAMYRVPDAVSASKKIMMLRRGLRCLEKHRNYRLTPEPQRVLARGYSLLHLGMLLAHDSAEEAGFCFSALRSEGRRYPLLFAAGLVGGLHAAITHQRMKDITRRLLGRLFREVRSRHRMCRGITDL